MKHLTFLIIIYFLFGEYRLKGSGVWSDEGCRLYRNQSLQKSKPIITCECNHLTTFAVIQRKPIPGKVSAQLPPLLLSLLPVFFSENF